MSAFYISPGDPPSKRAILTTALETFARDGIAATSVRAIAEAAGYTNPALFKFFKTKDELALYLFERCYRENLRVLELALSTHTGFHSRLRAALIAMTAFVDEQPEAFFFVQDNLRAMWPKLSKAASKTSMLREFRALIELGRSEGLVNKVTPIELQLAAMVGFLSQLARMNYFDELHSGITTQVDHIEAMIFVMLKL